MTAHDPIDAARIDTYDLPAIDWSHVREQLETGWRSQGSGAPDARTFWLATVRPDGRPHATAVGALWVDDRLFFTSGPGTRKSRNLGANPACTMSVSLSDVDVTIEGRAGRVTDPATLERVAALYRDTGWPAEVDGDALTAPYSAPSAGPAPWWVWELTPHVAFGVGTTEPGGAMRWRFED